MNPRSVAHRNFAIAFVIAAFVVASAFTYANDNSSSEERIARMKVDIQYLASDELEGRGLGTKGINLAADYLQSTFEKIGLDVTKAGGDAFQEFDYTTGATLGETNTLTIGLPEDHKLEPVYGDDFRTCSFGGSGSFSGQVAFCGYGIQAEDLQYDDFAGIDLTGKVAIIMRRNPRQDDKHSDPHTGFGIYADLRSKLNNAASAGAVAVFFVNDPQMIHTAEKARQKELDALAYAVVEAATSFEAADPQNADDAAVARKKLTEAVQTFQMEKQKTVNHDVLIEFGYAGIGNADQIPVFHISQSLCNQLLKATINQSVDELETAIDRDLKPHSAILEGVTVKGTTSINRVVAEVKNVVAVIEGNGPLADETIVIGAHYDHLGRGGEGSLTPGSNEIHNGADDNASGTVTLLELARRFAVREEKLPRRLVFIAFTAEERGLIGSARYTKEPIFPLENTVAMFNMDMVGRMQDDKMQIFGTGTSTRWDVAVDALAEKYNVHVTKKPEGFGPSDHSSFYAKKIPVLHFFTGTHNDYHRPSDDWEKINLADMNRVADILEELIIETANTTERPEYIEVQTPVTLGRGGNRPYFGSIPDFGNEEPGYAISAAAPNSPAEKAGLKSGDLIIKLGTHKITGLDDFDLALRKFSAGDTIDVVVKRKGEDITLQVTLAKPR
ncbi:MAG: M20/M25/M40 family metallo-hydrolase [Planctomycetota bacterium]|nr:M20/M25/M40 family metallo-hydrolase [Planctomycetota bacterium]MDA1212646.1 M20/M25/M40 family metallo-hydrolase [Planctomycetota bacterium]